MACLCLRSINDVVQDAKRLVLCSRDCLGRVGGLSHQELVNIVRDDAMDCGGRVKVIVERGSALLVHSLCGESKLRGISEDACQALVRREYEDSRVRMCIDELPHVLVECDVPFLEGKKVCSNALMETHASVCKVVSLQLLRYLRKTRTSGGVVQRG